MVSQRLRFDGGRTGQNRADRQCGIMLGRRSPRLSPTSAARCGLGAWRMWAQTVKDISMVARQAGAGIKRAFDVHSPLLASLTNPAKLAPLGVTADSTTSTVRSHHNARGFVSGLSPPHCRHQRPVCPAAAARLCCRFVQQSPPSLQYSPKIFLPGHHRRQAWMNAVRQRPRPPPAARCFAPTFRNLPCAPRNFSVHPQGSAFRGRTAQPQTDAARRPVCVWPAACTAGCRWATGC